MLTVAVMSLGVPPWRQVEALQDFVERVAHQFSCGVPDSALGGMCALLKVHASKTFEYCAREASQIFGGASIVKVGAGFSRANLFLEYAYCVGFGRRIVVERALPRCLCARQCVRRAQEGKGKLVERLYREVRAQAIPGGSEEILLDFAIRQAAGKAARDARARM